MDNHDQRIADRIDREVLGSLYEQYHDPIYRYCSHRLFTPEAAEDVTSGVFLAMVKDVGRFRGAPQTELKRWLYAVATKQTAQYIRDTSRRKQLLAAAAAAGRLGAQPKASNNGYPRWSSVFQAIQRLKPHEQAVVTLRFLEGLGMDDIAAVLGRKAESVRVTLSRAVKKLRDRLADIQPKAQV
ncbi:MAG: RNA polymerase sigma factor [Phycisphaerae bacterium]|nr:RNA polymerase sigma factor [Phycisphaerae bacterium]